MTFDEERIAVRCAVLFHGDLGFVGVVKKIEQHFGLAPGCAVIATDPDADVAVVGGIVARSGGVAEPDIARGNDRPLVGPQNGGDSDALCVPILKREHILLPDDSRVLLYVGFCLENILRQSRIIDTHAVDGAVVGISE